MGTTQTGEVDRPYERTGEGILGGMPCHSVEGRLHGAGGDLEGFQKIGLESDGQSHGDDDRLDVFGPRGMGLRG